MGAKGDTQKKQAWKFARAVSYLTDSEGVAPEAVAKELRKRGGIKKIARVAAESEPRSTSPLKRKIQPIHVTLTAKIAKRIKELRTGAIVHLTARRARDPDELLEDIEVADDQFADD